MPTNNEIKGGFASRIAGRKLPAWMLVLAMSVAGGEGLRQTVYIDPVGIPTVCFGETGKHVRVGQPARSLDQCSDLMLDRLVAINKRLDEIVKVPLTDGERIGYSSMIYNLGEGKEGVKDGFVTLKSGRQTTLLTKLNAGDHVGACNEIPKWANPSWLRGLKIRRAEEQKFCLRDLKAANNSAYAWSASYA